MVLRLAYLQYNTVSWLVLENGHCWISDFITLLYLKQQHTKEGNSLFSLDFFPPTLQKPFGLEVAALFFHSLWPWPSLCLHLYFITHLQDRCVRAIFVFTSYAGFVFLWNATIHSECPLPHDFFFLKPFFPLRTSHTPFLTLSSTSHTPPCFYSLSLTCLASSQFGFCHTVFISHSLWCSPPYMLIMFQCSERKLLNHSHQDSRCTHAWTNTHTHTHTPTHTHTAYPLPV